MGQHRPDAEWELARLTQALSLTPDQQTQVKALLQQRHENMKALRANGTHPTREHMMGVRKDTDAKISALLTNEQKAKFAAVQQQLEHDHSGNDHRTPPPPPPPSA
jgi:Spy/CpxP family protein refolding chaperone